MRKVDLICLISGVVLTVALFFARRTEWFLAEQARAMSDFAEMVESAFWAALVLAVFGLFLLLLSLRPTENLRRTRLRPRWSAPGSARPAAARTPTRPAAPSAGP